jgi:hypothetical protein
VGLSCSGQQRIIAVLLHDVESCGPGRAIAVLLHDVESCGPGRAGPGILNNFLFALASSS